MSLTRARWVLRRLTLMSPAEILWRTLSAARRKKEQWQARRPRASSGTARFRQGVPWFLDLARRAELQREAAERFGWTPAAADELLKHRFTFFAFTAKDFGPEIDWNRDYKSGTRTPMSYGPGIDYRDEARCGDIKYAWEHNRHHHLVELAKAFYLTGDVRYRDEVAAQIDGWIRACPYPFGINWSSALECAIRVINWCFAWQFLQAVPGTGAWAEERGLDRRMAASLEQHLAFIRRNLSRHSSANNHLIGELSGLFIGSLCLDAERSREWAATASRMLQDEALKQNWDDGVNKEQALSYQAFVFDFLLFAALLGERSGGKFSAVYWQRLERMAEFVAALIDPEGDVPGIGDEDDGYVAVLTRAKGFTPYRSMLATAAALFDRADLKDAAGTFDEKSFWLLGPEGAARFDRASRRPGLPDAFPQGGYYILRHDDARLIFDCGPLGYLSLAAHGHADALSILLDYRGQRFLVDPGTYAYHTSRQWRDHFRGTAAHNTVRVDRQDQSVIGGNFMWLQKAAARVTEVSGDPVSAGAPKGPGTGGLFVVSGVHDGYRRLRPPLTHERTVRYVPEQHEFVVTDRLRSSGRHTVEQFFHFSPRCSWEQAGRTVRAQQQGTGIVLVADPKTTCTVHQGSLAPMAGWYSPGFDRKVPAPTLCCAAEIDGDTDLVTRIQLCP